MIKQLYIRNYTLIQELELNPDKGLNVITGETGAGKSILIGALGLVLGQRADHGVMKDQTEKCIVEAAFATESAKIDDFLKSRELDINQEVWLRREISPGGKSRAFINDTPVGLQDLKELGELLVEIQTQSSVYTFRDSNSQLDMLDAFANLDKPLENYRSTFKKYKELSKYLEDYKSRLQADLREREFLAFQLNELTLFNPQIGEEINLENDLDYWNNTGEIAEGLGKILLLLQSEQAGVLVILQKLKAELKTLEKYLPAASNYLLQVENAKIELQDLEREIAGQEEEAQPNPELLLKLNDRWNRLQNLLKKHGLSTCAELVLLQTTLESKLMDLDSGDMELEKLQNEVNHVYALLIQQAKEISNQRKQAAPLFCKALLELLVPLEMASSKLEIRLDDMASPGTTGIDSVQFLFSANTGKPLAPLEKAASGGELSRILFATRAILTQKRNMPCLILDEADTGVSGRVADTMGKMMQDMGKTMQLIAITHLPQVAASGKNHYLVHKTLTNGNTVTNIKKLNMEERQEAIAAMLSGNVISDAAMANAKDLLKSAEI